MIMDFPVAASVDLKAIKPGTRVNFTIEQEPSHAFPRLFPAPFHARRGCSRHAVIYALAVAACVCRVRPRAGLSASSEARHPQFSETSLTEQRKSWNDWARSLKRN
jgi:hypothetical protein